MDKNLHNAGMPGWREAGMLNNAIWRRGVAALFRLCRIPPSYTPTLTPLDPYPRTIPCNRMLIGKYLWHPSFPVFPSGEVLEFIYRTYVINWVLSEVYVPVLTSIRFLLNSYKKFGHFKKLLFYKVKLTNIFNSIS